MRADNISNNPIDNSTRAVGSKRRIKVAEDVFGVRHKTTTHSDVDCRAQHKQGNGNANVATVQPSRVGMCSALDLPEQANEPERPCIVFSATEVTSTAASTQTEGHGAIWSAANHESGAPSFAVCRAEQVNYLAR